MQKNLWQKWTDALVMSQEGSGSVGVSVLCGGHDWGSRIVTNRDEGPKPQYLERNLVGHICLIDQCALRDSTRRGGPEAGSRSPQVANHLHHRLQGRKRQRQVCQARFFLSDVFLPAAQT